MKQKGFTLVELLIVIIIVVLTTILITVKITKNIKDAKELKEKQIISTIESAAYLYATTYQEELSTLNSINVESIPISTLISKGLLNSNSIDDIPSTNLVIIAIIENDIRTKYNKNQTYDNAIFLNGLKEISISKGSTYVDSGAYVAIANTGITLVPQEKITSSVNTNQKGKYKVTYSYDNAENIERIVNVTNTNLETNSAVITLSKIGNMQKDNTLNENLRYSGSNPNNYVYFNCDDYSNQTSAICEVWRIIGIFDVDDGTGKIEKRVKIIRNESIGGYSWDSSESTYNDGGGYNVWETKEGQTKEDGTTRADINDMLNKMYLNNETITCYNGQSGATTACPTARIKNQATKDLIGDAVWNLGGTTYTNANGYAYNLPTLDTYNKERGTTIYWSAVSKTTWTGKIGLIYPSDFGYASTNSECRDNLRAGGLTSTWKCTKVLGNWLNEGWYWTLSPLSSSTDDVFYANGEGYVDQGNAYNALGVRPVVYLKSSAKITGGNGTNANPYQLSL